MPLKSPDASHPRPAADGAGVESCRLRALERAQRYLGVAEDPPGSNRGRDIERWQKWANGLTGYPWCAAFLCGMVREACGLVVPTPKRASVGFLEAWASEVGSLLKPGTRPRRGDWICYRFDADDWPDHIGAVERVVAFGWAGRYAFGTVRTIEGNVGDAVRRKYRSVRRVRFVRLDAKKLRPAE